MFGEETLEGVRGANGKGKGEEPVLRRSSKLDVDHVVIDVQEIFSLWRYDQCPVTSAIHITSFPPPYQISLF
jgi:hypothetical protein